MADDVFLMMQALKTLGVSITPLSTPHSYQIEGVAGEFPIKKAEIFCGNSGTTMRSLTAMLALSSGNYTLTGVERMEQRPILDLVSGLQQLGADIRYLKQEGYPPLQIQAFHDTSVETIPCNGENSSQYLTGLLMACTRLNRKITIQVQGKLMSKSYVDMTLSLLKKFGCNTTVNALNYTIEPSSYLQGIDYIIEPDASSASYFLACAALNGTITVNNIGTTSLQGDKNFALVLEKMGAKVKYSETMITVAAADTLQALTINMEDMPDSAMTLAVLCLFATGVSCIQGISTWKLKETDRLQAMQTELTKLGAKVEITADSITIIPPDKINSGVAIDTYDDHRMAMSFSLVAAAGVEITINDYRCVEKTFANYFEVFSRVC